MRLLTECTHVYNHPHVNSGIQRVVRNITQQLEIASTGIECIPVVFKKNTLYQVLQLKPNQLQRTLASAWQWLEARRGAYWRKHAHLEQSRLFSISRNLRRALYVLAHLFDLAFLATIGIVRLILHRVIDRFQLHELEHRSGDVLLLLDSSWQPIFFSVTERLKSQGLSIVAVIYDLIPITHPQFFDAALAKTYRRWFDWIAQVADGFISISADVNCQTQQLVLSQRSQESLTQCWFDYFHLGSELDLTDTTQNIPRKIIATFADDAPVYLAVSTIEPRKNHAYLLDAFEQLWSNGASIRLCIVGRIGWKCESFIRRVQTHPERGNRLFMYNNISDTMLEYCYQNAKALVCPSFAEGFGLPLVEAMQRKLPVLASDIAIFREVGGDFAAYFDLLQPSSLAALITTFEQTGKFPAARAIQEWRWLNWREAAQMLVQKIRLHNVAESNTKSL